jgi:hypothetical protein
LKDIVRRPTAAIHADLDAGGGKALEILWAGEVAALITVPDGWRRL